MGRRRNGRGSHQYSPCPLGHWGACWAPGPNPRPLEPSSGRTEPKPRPYTTPRALTLQAALSTQRPPSTMLGLNSTHSPSPRALPPNSGTTHSEGPPLDRLPLPFCTGPNLGPAPCLIVTHTGLPTKSFLAVWVLSLGPAPPYTPPLPKFHPTPKICPPYPRVFPAFFFFFFF